MPLFFVVHPVWSVVNHEGERSGEGNGDVATSFLPPPPPLPPPQLPSPAKARCEEEKEEEKEEEGGGGCFEYGLVRFNVVCGTGWGDWGGGERGKGRGQRKVALLANQPTPTNNAPLIYSNKAPKMSAPQLLEATFRPNFVNECPTEDTIRAPNMEKKTCSRCVFCILPLLVGTAVVVQWNLAFF